MTARQMETWAHGFEVFDLFGATRNETDRIRNIVVLGVNTFGWSHQVHGLACSAKNAGARADRAFGRRLDVRRAGRGRISGTALDFAAVVTQTRALEDTTLSVEGDIARIWMENAQCFAGPPETPPAPGSRHRQDRPANAP